MNDEFSVSNPDDSGGIEVSIHDPSNSFVLPNYAARSFAKAILDFTEEETGDENSERIEVEQAVSVQAANEMIEKKLNNGWSLRDQNMSNPEEGVTTILMMFEKEREE